MTTKPATAKSKPSSKPEAPQYYSLDAILKRNATYNVIFGERSNGKTYAALKYAIKQRIEDGSEFAYIRRWKEDVTGRRASQLFSGLIANNEVARLSNKLYTGVHYYAGKFYLCEYDDDTGKPLYNSQGGAQGGDLLGYGFALSDVEHDKSTSYPNVKTIIFDEFLTTKSYFPDEFVTFMNVISTIVRRRTDVRIFMLGNTVNKYAPYFKEMGLRHVPNMKQGTIDLYTYGDSELTVAVEYCNSRKSPDAKTNKYFAFDNPKLHMITDGAWALDIYPHLPMKYVPDDVIFNYFIVFEGETYHAEIVNVKGVYFTYIHRKTTPIKNPEEDLIYTFEPRPEFNYCQNIYLHMSPIQERILFFFKTGRVYYQDNEVGDAIKNYLNICKRNAL